jgi:hypothetical protein
MLKPQPIRPRRLDEALAASVLVETTQQLLEVANLGL